MRKLTPAKPAAHVAPAKGKRKKDAPKSKRRHTAPAAAKDPVNVAREGSKKSEVIDLMRRSQGATLCQPYHFSPFDLRR